MLIVFAVFAFAAALARVVTLQTVDADRYIALGESQRVKSLALPAERGTIFDRNGFELALSVPEHTVWADPRLVTAPVATAGALSPVLGIDAATLEAKLTKPGAEFVYLSRKIDDATAAAVERLHLPGVSLLDESGRYLPSGELAKSVIGQVDIDNKGIAGLESEYETNLAGTPGRLERELDPAGNTIPSGQRRLVPAHPGDDLMLTLDRSMQYQTEQVLESAVTAAGARGGMAIVQDPNTGDILAMANIVGGQDGTAAHPSSANEALTNVFEPGSVNKVITVSAAVQEGLVQPNTSMQVPDRLPVSDGIFTDDEPHPTETWSVTDIVTRSSNVGTIMLARQLGKTRIDKYLRAFGLGSETALAFPGESAGLMLDPLHWSGTSIATVPIGQGISVTALQMLEAYDVIATGGNYVAPRLVMGTVDASGKRHDAPAADRRRVLSADTAAKVNGMLQEVVRSKDGTGFRAAVDGYTVAGKTGTARKPNDDGTPGYKEGAYVASFAGFVPAEQPRISIIVVIDEPQSNIYASAVAAPVFADLARFALREFKVAPIEGAAASASTTADTNDARLRPGDAADVGFVAPTTRPTASVAATKPSSGG